ncbi:hypothetical protein VTK56DRAFT_6042 [Thermocarpiscus australiensis]
MGGIGWSSDRHHHTNTAHTARWLGRHQLLHISAGLVSVWRHRVRPVHDRRPDAGCLSFSGPRDSESAAEQGNAEPVHSPYIRITLHPGSAIDNPDMTANGTCHGCRALGEGKPSH